MACPWAFCFAATFGPSPSFKLPGSHKVFAFQRPKGAERNLMPRRSEAELGWVLNPLHRAKTKSPWLVHGLFVLLRRLGRAPPFKLPGSHKVSAFQRPKGKVKNLKMRSYIGERHDRPSKKSPDDFPPCLYNITQALVIRQKKFFCPHLCILDIYKWRHL